MRQVKREREEVGEKHGPRIVGVNTSRAGYRMVAESVEAVNNECMDKEQPPIAISNTKYPRCLFGEVQ